MGLGDLDGESFEGLVRATLGNMKNKRHGFFTCFDAESPRFAAGGGAGLRVSKVCEFNIDGVRMVLDELQRASSGFVKSEWVEALGTRVEPKAVEKFTPVLLSSAVHDFQLALLLFGVPDSKVLCMDERHTGIRRDPCVPLVPPQLYNGATPPFARVSRFPSHYCAKCRKQTRQKHAFKHNVCWEKVLR
jgi:hypothetical protein